MSDQDHDALAGAMGTTPMRARLTAQVTRADTGEVEHYELTDWSEVPDDIRAELTGKPSFRDWFRGQWTRKKEGR